MARLSALLLLPVILLSVGCASLRKATPERRDRVEAESVEQLRQRIVELQRRVTMTEVEVERLRRQVAELRADQPMAAAASAPAPAPERRTLQPAPSRRELPELAQPVVIEEADLEVADLEPRAEPSERAPAAEDEGPLLPAPEPAEDQAASTVTEEGQALYDRGYTLFHRGQYLDAETAFQQFLAGFGTTDLGDNAQFWIGEARFARADLSGAMAAFREVVSRYPEGNKVPDALLKVGDCQHRLGDMEGARRSYQSVVDRFPFAAAAAVAEDRLRELP